MFIKNGKSEKASQQKPAKKKKQTYKDKQKLKAVNKKNRRSRTNTFQK